MWISLRFEAFVQVAQDRSFSKAAEALFLTQPSVTARIQSLERDSSANRPRATAAAYALRSGPAPSSPATARRALKALQDGRDAIEGMRTLGRHAKPRLRAHRLRRTYSQTCSRQLRSLHRASKLACTPAARSRCCRWFSTTRAVSRSSAPCTTPEITTVPLNQDDLCSSPRRHMVRTLGHRDHRRHRARVADPLRQGLQLHRAHPAVVPPERHPPTHAHGARHDRGDEEDGRRGARHRDAAEGLDDRDCIGTLTPVISSERDDAAPGSSLTSARTENTCARCRRSSPARPAIRISSPTRRRHPRAA